MLLEETYKLVTYEKAIRLPSRLPAPSLRISESYFALSAGTDDSADVIACLFCDVPIARWRCYKGCTLLLDLRRDTDELFEECSKTTRYEISRARLRDELETTLVLQPTEPQVTGFVSYYDAFATSKGVPRCHPGQLHALADAGRLALCDARGPDGSVLAAHAYVVGSGRARLTHSASLFRLEHATADRARISRANRLLHWQDMVNMRAAGMTVYDFGGWYLGTQDEARLKINAFKKTFGGQLVREWSAFQAVSPLGRAYLALRHVAIRASL